jgi:hypothetical protein
MVLFTYMKLVLIIYLHYKLLNSLYISRNYGNTTAKLNSLKIKVPVYKLNHIVIIFLIHYKF